MTDIDMLIDRWMHKKLAIRAASKDLWDLEQEIGAWMKENRAEERKSGDVTVTFKPEMIYDYNRLETLKEVMSPEEFGKILTDPKPVEIRVNVVKAKQLAKQGEPYRSIVEAASIVGLPVLKIKEESRASSAS